MNNRLSAQEKKAGWQLLFDGSTMNGWRGFQGKPVSAWDVEDGALHCNSDKKPYTDLTTDGEYASFILSVQWKISPVSNSGIMFHVDEDHNDASDSGPEYQIIDGKGWPGKLGKLEPSQYTGANYAMRAPRINLVKPVGEWNTTRIVVNGSHVEHWLNGIKLLEYELWSPDWNKRRKASKWKDYPGYGINKTGHIALQYHRGNIWYRNIKIRVL